MTDDDDIKNLLCDCGGKIMFNYLPKNHSINFFCEKCNDSPIYKQKFLDYPKNFVIGNRSRLFFTGECPDQPI